MTVLAGSKTSVSLHTQVYKYSLILNDTDVTTSVYTTARSTLLDHNFTDHDIKYSWSSIAI